MKNNLIVFFSFLFATNTFSQTAFTTVTTDTKLKQKFAYLQYDATMTFIGNPDAGTVNEYTNEKESMFVPDGLGVKIGYGIHFKKWIALGIHSGINWEWTDQLVTIPVFANFKLSPKIGIDFKDCATNWAWKNRCFRQRKFVWRL